MWLIENHSLGNLRKCTMCINYFLSASFQPTDLNITKPKIIKVKGVYSLSIIYCFVFLELVLNAKIYSHVMGPL